MVQPAEDKEICEEDEYYTREYRNIQRVCVQCKNCSQIIGYYHDFNPNDGITMKVYFGNIVLNSHFKLSNRCLRCRCDKLLGFFDDDGIHLYIFRNIMELAH